MSLLTANYWEKRYQDQSTGWDLGTLSDPLKQFFETLKDQSLKILIPGCGNAHEASFLHKNGFSQVYICDWAISPLKEFALRHPDFDKNHLIHDDFFKLKAYNFDLIIEQTFLCALDPTKINEYASKTASLLKDGAKLTGLLFKETINDMMDGPPFGATKEHYNKALAAHYSKLMIEDCYNSIPPRAGNEFFFYAVK